MKLRVEYAIDAPEFEPPNGLAVAMTLHHVQSALITAMDVAPEDGGLIRDTNGNTIGTWDILGDE